MKKYCLKFLFSFLSIITIFVLFSPNTKANTVPDSNNTESSFKTSLNFPEKRNVLKNSTVNKKYHTTRFFTKEDMDDTRMFGLFTPGGDVDASIYDSNRISNFNLSYTYTAFDRFGNELKEFHNLLQNIPKSSQDFPYLHWYFPPADMHFADRDWVKENFLQSNMAMVKVDINLSYSYNPTWAEDDINGKYWLWWDDKNGEYVEHTPSVWVNYIDQDGKTIAPIDKFPGEAGKPYSVSPKKIPGYILDDSQLPDNNEGVYVQDVIIPVTYVYNKEKAAPVTVKYINEKNEEIHDKKQISGFIGDTYDTSTEDYKLDLTAQGYQLDTTKLPDNVKGTLSDKEQEVIYRYKRIPIEMENGSFESPAITSVGWIANQKYIPGWSTTASDQQIELQKNGFKDETGLQPIAKDGIQWAELNAYQVAALYQDVKTTPGETIYWQVAHRGRRGTDTAIVEFGKPGETLQEQKQMSDSNKSWGHYEGYYKVPEGQTLTRFQFRSVSAAGGNPAVGNYLDDVVFTNIQTNVIIHYVDELGNEIQKPKTITGYKGQDYDLNKEEDQLKVLGYELDKDKLPANISGKFKDEDQNVTLTYKSIVPAIGYIEVPKEINLHQAQDKGIDYITGKGKIVYHSVENVNDVTIQVDTDPTVRITSPVSSVDLTVYHDDHETSLQQGTSLCEVSKEAPSYTFYLKALKKQFSPLKEKYSGNMIFTAKFHQ